MNKDCECGGFHGEDDEGCRRWRAGQVAGLRKAATYARASARHCESEITRLAVAVVSHEIDDLADREEASCGNTQRTDGS